MPTPAQPTGRPGIPAPPGGHALWVDPDEQRHVQTPPSASLPVSEEISAGGLVIDASQDVPRAALIARRNRGGRLEWCLPKGHLEGVETAEEAAVREIAEETGITGVVERHVGTIDYWFTGDDRRVHKVVHHFLLRAVGGRITVEGDPDHEAEDAAWVPLDDLGSLLAYPNERRVAHAAREALLGRPTTVHLRSSVTTHRSTDAS
ncbi:NUDIX hydrolase [Luteimicrobium subarcticum]|uniref:NUDIX domain-containing protein n=1 Tax=Luteimicrobium subarcticum TaxID=620910 RepID=A0A2M8WJM0_9MICO|nr:NUDIX hydrolase [Luteimicrobium subarcticum]PJI91086.1 NUDIX domain-containing protein [Luteimicrobium subarcticum]